ncbi:hypothetical protein BC940DRAFT_322817 [Gongronella butleri]|nr:hypothetical protein BC940DRAFT_322817 [Gongronella butleri]
MYEYDAAPTVSQERMAQRIHRALHTVYAVEPLPTHLVTQTAMTIRDIKVARNLRACRIFYEPTSTNKAEQARVEKAMDQHGLLLAKLVKEHALLRRPISIKFALASEEKRRLDDIYDQLEQQLRDE